MLTPQWMDYELLDMRKSEKLERFGKYLTIRPDPQIIWDSPGNEGLWKSADMHYHRSATGGGVWKFNSTTPDKWIIAYNGLKFAIKPTDFKHMGIFPEQAVNWDWMAKKISNRDSVRVLNLFAYTGGATLACSMSGASVCHVDASKGVNQWAKENAALSGLENNKLRFITDDVVKFVKRELRRGVSYDAIIMDPPTYGRGPSGEMWKIESLNELVGDCVRLLSEAPLFFLINSYTAGFSSVVLENILRSGLLRIIGNGKLYSGELGLKSKTGFVLPCGIFARWEHE